MSAQDHLEELQAAYRPFHYLVDILLSRRDIFRGAKVPEPVEDGDIPRFVREMVRGVFEELSPDTGLTAEQRENLTREAEAYHAGKNLDKGWAVRSHRDFSEGMSEQGRAILAGMDLAVGELSTASFNSSAIPVPGHPNSWVIALNQGVSALIYEVARTVAATFKMDGGTKAASEALTPPQAGEILHERLNHYIHVGVPFGRESKVSYLHVHLASSVTTMAERFVYAHELAHILLGHHTGAALRAVPEEWSGAEEVVHKLDQEHEADLLAWSLLSRVLVRSMSDLQLAYAGVSLFLRVAHILEQAQGTTSSPTHPPAARRLEYVRQAVEETVREVGAPLEQVSMIERAMSDGLDRAWRTAPPLPGECPLEELLDRAASSAIPDYMSFQQETLRLLSHSAPAKVCRKLGHAMAKAEVELRRLGVLVEDAAGGGHPDPSALRRARVPFNRWKLVGGLLGLYLTPEIGKYIERHRAEYLRSHSATA